MKGVGFSFFMWKRDNKVFSFFLWNGLERVRREGKESVFLCIWTYQVIKYTFRHSHILCRKLHKIIVLRAMRNFLHFYGKENIIRFSDISMERCREGKV
jgi:hypothetical protein